MCGICGALSLRGGPDVDPAVIERMRDTMSHRGPDDAGSYVDPDRRLGMGHRRLSIVDLSPAGHGPMANEDGTIWISYNGEVYNHAALRQPLEGAGHQFRSRTDTEILIHLYEERGPDMLAELRGMFAFSLWDAPRRRLLLARDRLGVKPLYYTFAGGQLLWASEIKALLAHPAVTPEIDEQALWHYLTFAAVPPPTTLFRGIRKLAAGHMLVLEQNGAPEVVRWWTAAGHGLPVGLSADDEQGLAAHLRDTLRSAVIEQTMADVPHGVLLSGGVDSSFILALLSTHLAAPVHTFSIGFENAPHFDERRYAAQVAARFGADHRELVLQPAEVMSAVPELIYGQDEPVADWTCVPMQLLARSVRQSGVIVVQVGEGSDELFAGYPRYRRYASVQRRWWTPYMRVPVPLRRAISAAASPLLARVPRWREPRDLLRRAARGEPLFLSGAVAHWESEKEALLTREARARLRLAPSSASLAMRNLAEFAAELPRNGRHGERYVASAIAYQDLMVRLPELLLMRVDKMTMLSSVEARVPFLDHRIVELGMALPDHVKLGPRGDRTKHIVKLAAEPLLGADVTERPKKGFDVPLADWLRREPLATWAKDTVLRSRLMRGRLFDSDAVGALFREHAEMRADHGFRLWNLVNLCAWAERWDVGVA
ncbi:MAG TPA: asparagine synthase (glutamine-hydrolyzing) [Gemmatimonadales bacterium]|nr:asparagine synthase (glutamine-hydrolyzing) [Gemmatimonadales bacterium]